ncbi:MAG: D-3-phosphoglycerate dehydrogenase / 2-oxoglutarate reductase [Thermomicrobiales bacterium]|jgi:D-3-phosphoglycerate dehydrogenase|nr:D-3-phosphoglycerate dehydrogenase / 2-oxoglutarate reductase [Thermomicrobiales bacterium]
MADKPTYTIAVTSDRYDLEWEAQELAALEDLRIELHARPCPTEDDLIALARDADAILISSREPITRRVVENLPRCKVIARHAVGIDRIDLDAAAEHGIVVTHVPDYCTAEVADHTLSLILALNRRIVAFDQDLRRGAWVEHRHMMDRILRGPIPPLRELTLGLVGIGRIGSAVAERARPFGMSIIAADPDLEPSVIRDRGAEPVALDELLARADIVSIHCPLTPETRGLIGERAFGLMKPSAFLVNTARGPIVDISAATAALENRRIAGAALDVVDPEPLPADSPLYRLDNVILTPHAAYYSERSVKVLRAETLKETLRVLRGQCPRTVANPAVLQRVNLAPFA